MTDSAKTGRTATGPTATGTLATETPAIRFVDISKRFQMDPQRNRSLMELPRRIARGAPPREYFWPLRNVTFEIARGTTVGLIGENGAGKSTLLKLTSRILQPTSGYVEINGRVSALLELGAGFHPELTGRDNIYLHCSLLGMSRKEIERIMEPVVRFADIGDFIDTAVKHYSSGMYARLGFAISVHVKPDILLVDEVLAVGDEAFQRRCLDTIDELRSRGVTIVLVTHSLNHVLAMCKEAIWLDEGQVREHGPTEEVVRRYLKAVDEETAQRLIAENALQDWYGDKSSGAERLAPPRRWGSGPLRITRVQMINESGAPGWSFSPMEPVTVQFDYEASEPVEAPVFSVLIHKHDGHYLWASNTVDHPIPPILCAGSGRLEVQVAGVALTAGRYVLSVAAYTEPDAPYWSHPSDYHEQLYEFQVTSELDIHGDVVMPSTWSHQPPAVSSTEKPVVIKPTPDALHRTLTEQPPV